MNTHLKISLMNTPKAFQLSFITPKAFANFSPGLERSDNPGIRTLNSH